MLLVLGPILTRWRIWLWGRLASTHKRLQFVCYWSQEYRKLALSSGLWLLATCTACSEIRFGVGTCQNFKSLVRHVRTMLSPRPGLSLHFFGILHISGDLESWRKEIQAWAKHTRARNEWLLGLSSSENNQLSLYTLHDHQPRPNQWRAATPNLCRERERRSTCRIHYQPFRLHADPDEDMQTWSPDVLG